MTRYLTTLCALWLCGCASPKPVASGKWRVASTPPLPTVNASVHKVSAPVATEMMPVSFKPLSATLPPPQYIVKWEQLPNGWGLLLLSKTNLTDESWIERMWCSNSVTQASFPKTNAAEFFRGQVEPDGLVITNNL